MIQRDFLKRQLEELGRAFGKVIADIMKLQEQGKVSEGILMVQKNLDGTFDLDIEEILSMPIDNFVSELVKGKNLTPVHLSYLGDILYATAELLEQKNETENVKILQRKVLAIFNYINETEKTFSLERNKKIETIKRTMN